MSASQYVREMNEMLEASKTMIPLIRDMDDRAICEKWMSRAKSLQGRDANMMKHRNDFVKYFVALIGETIANAGQTPGCCKWDRPPPGVFDKRVPAPEPLPYQCHWTPDKRVYAAIQPLPNRGAMVYMAVAEKPELGWEFPNGDEQL